MEKQLLVDELLKLWKNCAGNAVSADDALPGCEGLIMYEEPIFGVSSAQDPIYVTFQQPEVVGPNFMLPEEWLPGARSVVSFFLPFTDRVRRSNVGNPEETSPEWLHARIEGQNFLDDYTRAIADWFRARGAQACVPSIDDRFAVKPTPLPEGHPKGVHIASNWSERHVAYASGLGTFCLSRGLISVKGVAGRYGSVIVTEDIPADERPYTGIYDYCIMCGACARYCPAGAITVEGGKNQILCRQWVSGVTRRRYDPRYGCGKCQVGVPCEHQIPNPKFSKSLS